MRIVSIGGGTGLSTLLRGLKRYVRAGEGSLELTAIVTVTDDGGSSGRLRRELDILPPGDIRNCMVAMADDEALLSRVFQHRFSAGTGLKGHSFGNLFLTAMTELTGDFPHAVRLSAEVLKVCGQIYPSTATNVTLKATLADGRIVKGETKISRSKVPIERISLEPQVAKPLPDALDAIARADLITLGPGSLFTSVVPNLLVKGIPEAIAASRATKAYFVNLMSQPGETSNFRASDHIAALLRHGGALGRPLVNVCVVNNRALPASAVARYKKQAAQPVANDVEVIHRMGMSVMSADLIRALRPGATIRHDPGAIGAIAVELALDSRRGRKKS